MFEADLKVARVLIVDDQVANICLLQNILNRLGYTAVESTSDPRDTLTCVEKFRPDLIILDLHMPFLDGYEVMQQLSKVVPREEFLPILVLTADATPAAKRRALAAGASDLLHKPFDTSEICMRIRNLIGMRLLHKALQNQNQLLEEKVAERTRELEQMQRQVVAQERLRAFGEMAGGVVHDFNNALMSVIGYSELLLQDADMIADTDTVRKFLGVINTAGRDASHVVSRLRDFYRPREATDVFSPIQFNDLVEQIVALTQPKWKDQALASGRSISVEVDLMKLPPVNANAAELREVATNLIFNAVDAMPTGGRLTLRTRHIGDEVVFEVIDSGTGMTEDVRARCLEPFFSTKGENGTGLGLSMVFGVIKRHEGQVEIDSAVGKGTTFRIRLPAQVQAFTVAACKDLKVQRALHVLIVDDEHVPRDVIKQYLLSDGHTVVSAASGVEALERMKADRFDLLLTDHAMPGMSGLQLAALVKQISANQPVILVTGFSDHALTVEDGQPHVDFIVRKPVPHADLRHALSTVFALREP